MPRRYESSLHVAVVCSSNMNRSMEAHSVLQKKGFNVDSFGTGDKVKLPGPSADRPNVYDFGPTYEDICKDLVEKEKPQRLQDSPEKFDLILTAEERVYDQALEWFDSNGNVHGQPSHVVNMDIQDNHEEATIGAFLFCELVQMLADSSDLDDEIDELLQAFEAKCGRPILHTVVFY